MKRSIYKFRTLLSAAIGLTAVGSALAASLSGCITNPPPLPPNNPADPQVRGSPRRPRDLLAPDETTLAINRQLAATQAYAESAEEMKHDMTKMHGMQHGEAQQSHDIQGRSAESQKKSLGERMTKTAEEMKETSQPLKEKSDEMKTDAAVYTCLMHPQVRSDKPGNCPICGMKLVPKKEGTHEEH